MRSPGHTLVILAILALTSATWAGETSPETTFTISGTMGLPGVTMQGLPGAPLSDENGRYVATVPLGWRGTVTPVKLGYTFSPQQRTYDAVRQDSRTEDYMALMLTFTISGTTGLPGVIMQGLPQNPVTDASGRYSAEVPYGWAGVVVPTKQGCRFEPESRHYSKMTASQHDQSFTPVRVSVAPSQSYGAGVMDVLVIPTAQVDPKAVAEIKEDMQVMVHILRETLSEPRMILGILYDYGDIFGSGDRGTRAFYLEGYGALFVMEVDFPFSFPSEAGPEEAPGQEVDPVWQRARQRLRAPGARRAYGQTPGDEMSFEQFKGDLIETLKHAANIRHVDPNENVILTIIGQDAGGAGADFSGARGAFPGGAGGAFAGGSYSSSGGSFGPGGGSTYANSHTYASSSGTPNLQAPALDPYGNMKRDALGNVVYQNQPTTAATTVLTIQAKKADVDAFSAGEIDLEQFQERVKVFTY